MQTQLLPGNRILIAFGSGYFGGQFGKKVGFLQIVYPGNGLLFGNAQKTVGVLSQVGQGYNHWEIKQSEMALDGYKLTIEELKAQVEYLKAQVDKLTDKLAGK